VFLDADYICIFVTAWRVFSNKWRW